MAGGRKNGELSEAQRKTLEALARGEQPRFVPPTTRRWLRAKGLITVAVGEKRKPPSRYRNAGDRTFTMAITDMGRMTIGAPLPEEKR